MTDTRLLRFESIRAGDIRHANVINLTGVPVFRPKYLKAVEFETMTAQFPARWQKKDEDVLTVKWASAGRVDGWRWVYRTSDNVESDEELSFLLGHVHPQYVMLCIADDKPDGDEGEDLYVCIGENEPVRIQLPVHPEDQP